MAGVWIDAFPSSLFQRASPPNSPRPVDEFLQSLWLCLVNLKSYLDFLNYFLKEILALLQG